MDRIRSASRKLPGSLTRLRERSVETVEEGRYLKHFFQKAYQVCSQDPSQSQMELLYRRSQQVTR